MFGSRIDRGGVASVVRVAIRADIVVSGLSAYPLCRGLFVYFNNPPKEPLDPLVRAFLAFVLSKQGQEIVVKDGYLPLNHAAAMQERNRLE